MAKNVLAQNVLASKYAERGPYDEQGTYLER
jgi:hypothetical protein